jgi:hypothetical protein
MRYAASDHAATEKADRQLRLFSVALIVHLLQIHWLPCKKKSALAFAGEEPLS